MNSFSEFQDFLIKIEYSNDKDYLNYKKIFKDQEIEEELYVFIEEKIPQLESNILKLALILKKYDILDKTKKNNYLKAVKDEILYIFFNAYSKEEHIYSVNQFLINFKPLRDQSFIIDHYITNNKAIGNPFGLIESEFIVDAKIPRESLRSLIQLAIIKSDSNTDKFYLMNMEKIFDVCEKMQMQDLKSEAAKRIVNHLILSSNNHEVTSKNLFIHQALKYVDHYGSNKTEKRKELLNLILDNSKKMHSYFDKNKKLHNLDLDKNTYENNLSNIRKIGAHQALYNISHSLFNLYDYENEMKKIATEPNILYMIATTIAYDESGLPLYIINNKIFDDIFFHEKTTNLILHTFLFNKYINYIRENSDFETYINDFHLPENLTFIRELDLLNDFKNRNFYGFISQMIPIIENYFRHCLGLVNEPYITPNGIGGYDFLPMKAFLDSNIIREKLGINSIYILKLIYDDRRGLNYRNKLAHGIINPISVTETEANLVFLTLIFISYFEKKL
ncbi:DUF4209 domain-containing protein [Acinetobacter beijerinckii]|uniref:DUF4209 domain-containing protein n=1 Tax=Acinetobacter beijerinckii TaxID=262668 RepID=UPI00405510F8